MSAIRLLVLGAIRQLGTAHGYAVRRQLDEWHVETWTTARSGSVYHAIGQLQKEGKLQTHASETGARGSDRTAFSLTSTGHIEFFCLLEEALSSFELTQLSAGIAFLDLLPTDKAHALLSTLYGRLLANRDQLKRLAATTPRENIAPRTVDLLDIWIGYLDATARSIHRLNNNLTHEWSEKLDFKSIPE